MPEQPRPEPPAPAADPPLPVPPAAPGPVTGAAVPAGGTVRRDPGGVARPRRQWPLLLVSAGVLGGLVAAFLGSATWRPGCVVVGASVVLGALLRLVLPTRRAGLLQVRGKAFDVLGMLLTGVSIVVLALVVPAGR